MKMAKTNKVVAELEKGGKATKGLLSEFKAFISKGNVLDLAVGVIIGSAFTAIVNSLVADIITPVLSLLTNKVDLTQLKIVLSEAVGDTPEVAITYGNFIQGVINFVIQAFVIFLIVKAFTSLSTAAKAKEIAEEKAKAEEEAAKKKEEEEAAAKKAEEPVELLREILAELKKQ